MELHRPPTFGETAKGLARSPLGIIALFIVLVYGFASLVTAFAGSFTAGERFPLVYFLVLFPVLVLAVFAWLVSRHSSRLFGPSDFRNEENFVKMQMTAVASLVAASAKGDSNPSNLELDRVVDVVRESSTASAASGDGWRNHILWVDDRPHNNTYERQAFEAVGLRFTLVESTDDALQRLATERFAAIISDMGRREGAREGYVLLDRVRAIGDRTPLFFYADSNRPEHKQETLAHGGQGCTNNSRELFQMVTRAIVNRQVA